MLFRSSRLRVEFTIDLRAPEDATRRRLEERVIERLGTIAVRRGVKLEAKPRHDVKAAPCALWLQMQLSACLERVGVNPMRLPSGAGHDAMVLAEVTDVGMMFVRCGAGGVSHNPAETVTAEDVDVAQRALLHFLRSFSPPRR